MDTLPVPLIDFSPAQIELIKSQVASGATNDELQLFLYHCRRTGLDPLAKQIYCTFRWTRQQDPQTGNWVKVRKMSIQTAIDGFRLIADRTGKYAGQLGPFWYTVLGGWQDVYITKPGDHPLAARVGVLRHDFKEPLWSVADWASYVQANDQGQPYTMWRKMGPLMIAKCAEALGLRRAFPQELSGLTTPDELPPEDDEQEARPVARPDAMRPQTVATKTIEHQPQEAMPPVEVVTEREPAPVPVASRPTAPPGKLSIPEIAALEKEARDAAAKGSAAFQEFWREAQRSAQKRAVIQGLRTELLGKMQDGDAAIAEQAERNREAEAANESNEATGNGELFR